MYQHRNLQGLPFGLPTGKVVCVGRNYLDHIQELNNAVPGEPLLFLKPATALCHAGDVISIPTNRGACHNELEVAILIGEPLSNASAEQAKSAMAGVGLALDLTLRDLQDQLKQDGHPWERAKAFDNACPVSAFAPMSEVADVQALAFSLTINGQVRQRGNTHMMMRDTVSLLVAISEVFTLVPGDIVLTGTPKGVGPLQPDDTLTLSMSPWFDIHTRVVGN